MGSRGSHQQRHTVAPCKPACRHLQADVAYIFGCTYRIRVSMSGHVHCVHVPQDDHRFVVTPASKSVPGAFHEKGCNTRCGDAEEAGKPTDEPPRDQA